MTDKPEPERWWWEGDTLRSNVEVTPDYGYPLEVRDGDHWDDAGIDASPRARALIAAAPELREALRMLTEAGAVNCKGWACFDRARALLDRLDAEAP